MTKISLTLKAVPPEERKQKLLDYIKKMNSFIDTHRKKHITNETRKFEVFNYSNGILVPFSPIGKTLFNSNLVKLFKLL